MSRSWLLVFLLATGLAMADDPAKPAAAESQAKKKEGAAKPAASSGKKKTKKKEEAARPAAGAAEGQEQKKEDETQTAAGATVAQPQSKEDDPDLGMSILGNQEAPKALVIVPWKSSEIGASLGISTMLDDSRQPIDKEVFMRVLNYYELMSKTTRQSGVPAGTPPARPAPTAHGRKS
ncbi:MAG TPA: hypothetical protein VFW45_02910 [Candidatus Polarisedimenticolia bacterium]|nr:hypothetical protein [Candidatus Polarisedimenticolia bacterium]